MHTGIEWRSPGSSVRLAPTRAKCEELDGRIGVSCEAQARENHHAAVCQHRPRRIPPPVSHGLLVRKCFRCGIECRGFLLAVKRIVLQRAAHHEWPSVRHNNHTVAKHVPADRHGRHGIRRRIPNRRHVVRVWRIIPRTGNDQHLSCMHQCDMHRVDGHGRRKGLPRADGACLCAGTGRDAC